MRRHLAETILLLLAPLVWAPAVFPQARHPSSPAFDSPEKEVALGKMLASGIERNFKIVEDPYITEYVTHLGRNLVQHADPNRPLSIGIIANDEPTGFVFPGGFLFLTTGLILHAEGEAEFAALLAREIAHLQKRHGARHLQSATFDIPLVALVAAPLRCEKWGL